MVKYGYIIFLFLCVSCHTAKTTHSYKNEQYQNYHPNKILILGVTPSLEAKTIYERELKKALNKRNIEAFEASEVLSPAFSANKQEEIAIEKEVKYLRNLGFDAIIMAAIKGFDEKTPFDGAIFKIDDSFFGFENYYFLNQDIYYNRDYFIKYNVYHLEVSLYNLTSKNEKTLVWIGNYDIVDPQKISETVKKCVRKILKSLEKEELI
ncbi:hypothetical protein [Lutibacter sp.]|uniref:hypothetical protein n=1 Tax=Lutibacter sp. TaxID=1925666 RepID=UPI0034A09942